MSMVSADNFEWAWDAARVEAAMAAIVDFPSVVKQALERFGPLFDNEPERRHLGEYLTGLMVAERKNVSAINPLSNSILKRLSLFVSRSCRHTR